MPVHFAPGLQADWLNGWLAGIGVTVALPDARLAWTPDPVPYAYFDHPEGDFAAALFQALPTPEALQASPLARKLAGHPELKRTVDLDVFTDRAAYERETGSTAIGCTITDLVEVDDRDGLPHSAFDPSVPKGITLWERAMTCRDAIVDAKMVDRTLAGLGERIKANGLGFDVRRLSTRAENTDNLVDPVVEILVFVALELFPIRGDGQRSSVRGWTGPGLRPGAFRWAAWEEPLDRWGIDAWLDRFHAGEHLEAPVATFESLPYQPTGKGDRTRAFASRRVS